MKTYELLDTPEKWTKEVFARDCKGDEVDPESPEAVCWCVKGALQKCYPNYDDRWEAAYHRLLEVRKYKHIVDWQDDPRTTYEEIIKVLKLADV
jgi:hypothetical protein